MNQGTTETMIQILNTGLLIGLLAIMYYIIFKLPRKLTGISRTLKSLEDDVKEIKQKIQ